MTVSITGETPVPQVSRISQTGETPVAQVYPSGQTGATVARCHAHADSYNACGP